MPRADAPSAAEVAAELERRNEEVAAEKDAALDAAAPEPTQKRGRQVEFHTREFGWLPAEELSVLEAPGGRFVRPGRKHLRVKLPDGRVIERLDVVPVGTEVRLPNGLSRRPEQIGAEWRETLATQGKAVKDLPPGRVFREV